MSDKEIEITQKEMFFQKQVLNPYPTGSQSYAAYEKGFVECFNVFFAASQPPAQLDIDTVLSDPPPGHENIPFDPNILKQMEGHEQRADKSWEDIEKRISQPAAVNGIDATPFESNTERHSVTGLTTGAVWVKASDRLPEQRIRVLVTYDNLIVIEAYIDFDGRWKFSDPAWALHDTAGITHWMPLPALPGESPTAAGDGKEDAVAFTNWTLTSECDTYTCTDEDQWTNIYTHENITTAQLYDIFKNRNK